MGLVPDQRPPDIAWLPLYSSSLFMLFSRLRGVGVKLTFPTLVKAKGRMELQGVWVRVWPEPSTGGGSDGRRKGELNG